MGPFYFPQRPDPTQKLQKRYAYRKTGPTADIAALFVVADAATLVTDACHIGFLWNGYARSGFREVVVLYGNATFRCGFSGVVLSLPKRVAFEFQSTNVDPHHGLICIRRQFSVRHVKAEDIQVAVVELFVVLVVELAQRCGLVGLERGNGAINMAFASAAVPDCWAAANPVQQNSTNAASAAANKFLLMAFSLWQTALKRSGSSSILRPLYPRKVDIKRL